MGLAWGPLLDYGGPLKVQTRIGVHHSNVKYYFLLGLEPDQGSVCVGLPIIRYHAHAYGVSSAVQLSSSINWGPFAQWPITDFLSSKILLRNRDSLNG